MARHAITAITGLLALIVGAVSIHRLLMNATADPGLITVGATDFTVGVNERHEPSGIGLQGLDGGAQVLSPAATTVYIPRPQGGSIRSTIPVVPVSVPLAFASR